MDRGLNDLATMTGARAGGAPNPGRGTGNVPFAPGVVSGRFGPQPPAGGPQRPAPPPPQASSVQAPQPSGGPPAPGAAPPGGQPGGLGLQSPINSVTLQPQIYFELMGAIMSALIDAANAPEGIV